MIGRPPVVFNYATWLARYPEFGNVSSDQAQGYFDEATLYCANSITNPAACILPTLLNMLTAHIAYLYSPDRQGIVGRISAATEGSVSVQTENQYEPGTAQWYQQSRYGASYWAATAPYRTARAVSRPTIVVNGAYPSRGGVY